jgi:hypothetical protein
MRAIDGYHTAPAGVTLDEPSELAIDARSIHDVGQSSNRHANELQRTE